MPPDSDARLTPLERFGRELARCRKELGLSQARLAERIGCSPSLIGHIETGSRRPQLSFAEACDRIFKLPVSDYFVRLWRRIQQAPTGPRWFMRWLDEVEPHATVLRAWAPFLIPGLLQTEDYARAVFLGHFSSTEAEVEEQVGSRMERQQILHRESPPVSCRLLSSRSYLTGLPLCPSIPQAEGRYQQKMSWSRSFGIDMTDCAQRHIVRVSHSNGSRKRRNYGSRPCDHRRSLNSRLAKEHAQRQQRRGMRRSGNQYPRHCCRPGQQEPSRPGARIHSSRVDRLPQHPQAEHSRPIRPGHLLPSAL